MRWRCDSKIEPRMETTLRSATPNNRAYTIKTSLPKQREWQQVSVQPRRLCFQWFRREIRIFRYGKRRQLWHSDDDFLESWDGSPSIGPGPTKRKKRSRFASAPPLYLDQAITLTGDRSLCLAQMDGAVPRVDRQRIAAAIHLAVNLRSAHGSLNKNRQTQADSPIVGAGVNIRLQVARHGHGHAAVAGVHVPAICQLGAGIGARGDAAVASFDVEGVETPVHVNVAIAAGRFQLAVQISPFDAAVAGPQPDIALGPVQANVAVPGVDINIAAHRIGFH